MLHITLYASDADVRVKHNGKEYTQKAFLETKPIRAVEVCEPKPVEWGFNNFYYNYNEPTLQDINICHTYDFDDECELLEIINANWIFDDVIFDEDLYSCV